MTREWVVFADTKTDQAEGAKAGLAVLDQGADLVIVSCDYDFGAPAALQAQSAGKVSFFLCAESVKAGIQGVGPYSFSASVLAAVQGATMAEWAYNKKSARSFYRLLDSWTVYNKGICDGFEHHRTQFLALFMQRFLVLVSEDDPNHS